MIYSTNPKDKIGATKPPISLIPGSALVKEAMAMKLGAEKYGPYNWRDKKVQALIYADAALRHLISYIDGQDTDPESGITHLAHVRACMGILIDAQETGNLIDNRPKKGATAELIHKHTDNRNNNLNASSSQVLLRHEPPPFIKDENGLYHHADQYNKENTAIEPKDLE